MKLTLELKIINDSDTIKDRTLNGTDQELENIIIIWCNEIITRSPHKRHLRSISSLAPSLELSGGTAILHSTCQSINSFLYPRFSFPHEKPMTDSARSAFKSAAEKAGSVSFPLYAKAYLLFYLSADM